MCSICGHDIHDRGLCSHVKGRTYEGKRCIARLADPTDAFEWSFVAVPAQPRAGVVKGFREAGTLEQLLSSLDQEGPWREELKALRRQAEMGRRYLDGLRQETVRLGHRRQLYKDLLCPAAGGKAAHAGAAAVRRGRDGPRGKRRVLCDLKKGRRTA